jgi:hypothetical protein
MAGEDDTLPAGYEDPVARESVPIDAPNTCGPSDVPIPGPGDLVNTPSAPEPVVVNGPMVTPSEPGCINVGGKTYQTDTSTVTGPGASVKVGNCGNPKGVEAYGETSAGKVTQQNNGTTTEIEGTNAKGGLSVNPNTGKFQLGAQANVGGVSRTFEGQNNNYKVGLSLGAGAEVRRDRCSWGGDLGPISFDMQRKNCDPTVAR